MSLFEHNYCYFPSFRLKNKGFLDSELDQVVLEVKQRIDRLSPIMKQALAGEYEQRMKSSHVQINNGTNIQSTMIHQGAHGYNGEQSQPKHFKDPTEMASVMILFTAVNDAKTPRNITTHGPLCTVSFGQGRFIASVNYLHDD